MEFAKTILLVVIVIALVLPRANSGKSPLLCILAQQSVYLNFFYIDP